MQQRDRLDAAMRPLYKSIYKQCCLVISLSDMGKKWFRYQDGDIYIERRHWQPQKSYFIAVYRFSYWLSIAKWPFSEFIYTACKCIIAEIISAWQSRYIKEHERRFISNKGLLQIGRLCSKRVNEWKVDLCFELWNFWFGPLYEKIFLIVNNEFLITQFNSI